MANLAYREVRHLVRIRLIGVLRRVRSLGSTTGSMPSALIGVGWGGALSGSRAPARTRRSRLFASGAVLRKRNAGNDLGLNARWCRESGKPGKTGRIEERDLPADSAVRGIRQSNRSRDKIAAIDATAASSRKVSMACDRAAELPSGNPLARKFVLIAWKC